MINIDSLLKRLVCVTYINQRWFACSTSLTFQENYEQVVGDCTKALDLNSKYIKALFRRAKAFEQKGDLTSCLEGIVIDVENLP